MVTTTLDTKRGLPRLRPAALASGALLVLFLLSGVAGVVLHAGAPTTGPVWNAVDAPHTTIHALTRAPWGVLYAATSQGVYLSRDAGTTWRRAGPSFSGSDAEAWGVAAVRDHGTRVVLATAGDGSVYRLAGRRAGWTHAGPLAGAQGAYVLYPLPQAGAVLVGSDHGIYRSPDSGHTWRLVAPIAGGIVASFARDPASGTVYAGLAGVAPALRMSADGGLTWRVPPMPIPPPSVEALAAAAGRVYAGVMGAPGGQAVWVGGTSPFLPLTTGMASNLHGMALAAMGHGLFAGTMGAGVYEYSSSYTGAAHPAWTRLGAGPGDGTIVSLLVLSGPGARQTLLAGTGDGIYRLAGRR